MSQPDVINGQDAADLGPDVTVQHCAPDGEPYPRAPARPAGVGLFLLDSSYRVLPGVRAEEEPEPDLEEVEP